MNADSAKPSEPNQTAAEAPDKPDELDEVLVETERRRTIEQSAAAILDVQPENLCELLRNVWKTSKSQPELTKQEMFVGISLIARFELDPISREVYVTRDKEGRLLTIVAIDGWIKILDRTPHYDGFEQELGWETDDNGQNQLKWVETRIYSKARSHPTPYRAFMWEYLKLGGPMSNKIPWHMLRLFSLRHAARLFVPLGGSVMTEMEAGWVNQESSEVFQGTQPAKANIDDLLEEQEPAAAVGSQVEVASGDEQGQEAENDRKS